jgi:hypothetical protein
VGDFNVYTSNVLEVTPEYFADVSAEVQPEVFRIPRSSDDQFRKTEIREENLLPCCEENKPGNL